MMSVYFTATIVEQKLNLMMVKSIANAQIAIGGIHWSFDKMRAENIEEDDDDSEEEHILTVDDLVYRTSELDWSPQINELIRGSVIGEEIDEWHDSNFVCSCGWRGSSMSEAEQHLIDNGVIDVETNEYTQRTENIN